MHIPTRTIIYIDTVWCNETRTIMRTELVAIHTVLTRFEDHSWLGIFSNSLSSLHAIRPHYFRPGPTIAPHYHHHMLLLQSISHLGKKATPPPFEKSGHTHASEATT